MGPESGPSLPVAEPGATDRLEPGLIARFHATLGPWLAPVPDGVAPLGAHWCLFPPLAQTADLGPDGHPPRLHPIPEADYPRRMWVGGSLDLHHPFPLDAPIARRTSLRPVEQKQGATGPFLLTGLDQHYSHDGRTLAIERQDIIYRPAHAGPQAQAQPHPGGAIPQADLRIDVQTPPTLLFRYSALTFNAHRIHFDEGYASGVEGHPGLLVHGPLQATLLLNLAARLAGLAPRHFRYRALRPLVSGHGLVATATRAADGIACAVHDLRGRRTLEGHASDAGSER
jgi:3-methylfumaryl-CoA hydratase